MKLRVTIYLITAVVVAGMLFLVVEFDRAAEDEVIRRFHAQQDHGIRYLVQNMDQYLHDRSQGAQVLSTFASVRHRDLKNMAADIQEYFQYVKKDHVKAISVYDEKGIVIYSTTEDAIGRNYAACDFFQWATRKENKGKQFVSSLIRATQNQSEQVPYFRFLIAAPVYQEAPDSPSHQPADSFVGVLTYTIDLQEVIAALLPLVIPNVAKAHVWIMDTSGTVLFQSEHPEMVLNSIRKLDETCIQCHVSMDHVETILAERQGTIEYELSEHLKKSAAYAPLTFDNVTWIIVVNVPFSEVSGFVKEQQARTLVLIGVIVAALVGASTVVYRNSRLRIQAEEETKHWREKRELEEQIRESEEHYRTVVDISPDAIVVHCEGKIVFVNVAGVRLLGARSADELIGTHALEVVHPDDRKMVKHRIAEVLEGGVSVPLIEERFLRMDGSTVDVEVAAALTTYQGKPAVQVVVRDITERKQVETALAMSVSEQRSIMETIPDIVFVLDLNGIFVKWNNSLEKVTGYSSEEIFHKPAVAFFDKEYQPIIAQAIRKTLEKGYNEVESPLRLRDGTAVSYLWKGAVMRDEKGSVIGVTGVGRDLTERKKAEEALRNSHSLLTATLESTADGILVVNTAGKVTGVNRKFVELWGIPETLVVARDDEGMLQFVLLELLDPDTFLNKVHALYQAPDESSMDELAFKDGRTFERYSQPQRLGDTIVGRVWSFRDITERKRAEEALRESEGHNRDLVEHSSDLICTHDLEGKLLSANPAATKLTGFTKEEFVGRNLRAFIAPESRRLLSSYLTRIQATGSASGLLPVVTKSGERRIWEYFNTLRTVGVSVPIVRSLARDITDRRRMEQTLRNSERQYRLLFENMLNGFAYCKMLYDDQGRPTDFVYFAVNSAFERVTGMKAAVGKTATQLIPEIKERIPELFEIFDRVASTGAPEAFEIGLNPPGLSLSISAYSTLKGYFAAVFENITDRKKEEGAILQAKEQLTLLTEHLRNVREEERARISREIHDELGQSLTALSIDLGWLHDQEEISIDSRKKLDGMIQIVTRTIGNVQRIASDLRPAILDDLGLTAAVEWYCDDFEERSAIHCETVLEDVEPVDFSMKLHMFRLFQESLTNVARHSLATSVSVHLMREADEITLEIVDDGIGIEERKIGASTSLGLLGMRERVKECHGRMTVARGPVKGTSVSFTIPAGG